MKQVKRIRNYLYGLAILVFLFGLLQISDDRSFRGGNQSIALTLVFFVPFALVVLGILLRLLWIAHLILNKRLTDAPPVQKILKMIVPALIAVALAIGFVAWATYQADEAWCPHRVQDRLPGQCSILF